MNLKTELDNYVVFANVDGKDLVRCVPFEHALRIAKEYAEEMCVKQIENCANHYFDNYEVTDRAGIVYNTILSTPLATEEEDGN